ncbi:hypothetical protein [Chryseobacterium sp. R2A-55]|uniref:8-oxoguanine DNA glycosylase OGG fold protein n=1 Tax=Chryseobacterium sp. R2A-55 TaxID=2744445 RepID=UPI001F338BD7|nr:hypothetical protein [Chryseobacterium sp. R2A-55]
MKTLSSYKGLINEMPVQEQAFVTKRITWEKKIDTKILDEIFVGLPERKISRNDIFSKCPIDLFVYLVIMWGYPRGMRGHSNDTAIFENINELSEIINLPRRGLVIENELEDVLQKLSDFPGLGISTISKLLYFRTWKFGDYDALILDERILRVFQAKVFEEFENLQNLSRHNALKYYLDYLKTMHRTSNQLKVSPVNLEMFLFIFGNNLK